MKIQMYKILIIPTWFMLLFFFNHQTIAQSNSAIESVKKILMKQSDDWNNGDIDAFMEHYWKSDQLQFIGSKGITYGWQNTLEGYKKRYPDKTAMGTLKFDILNVTQRSKKVISLVGRFHLKRTIGDLSGHFLLIFQKIKGRWVITADHTS